MVLSKNIKDNIEKEYNYWVNIQYAGNSKEKRKELGQFYTPPVAIIKLIENFPDIYFKNGKFISEKTMLDPTSGAGGLLIGAYFAGIDIKNLYGIELDQNILENVCYKRFDRIIDELKNSNEEKDLLKGIIRKHIRLGNALNKACYIFNDNDFLQYKETRKLNLKSDTYRFDVETNSVSFIDVNGKTYNFDLNLKWTLDNPKEYFSQHSLVENSNIKKSFFGGLS